MSRVASSLLIIDEAIGQDLLMGLLVVVGLMITQRRHYLVMAPRNVAGAGGLGGTLFAAIVSVDSLWLVCVVIPSLD